MDATAGKKRAALAMNLIAILTWAVGPIMIRSFKDAFPVNFQNFFRYLVSLAVVWTVYLIGTGPSERREHFVLARRSFAYLALLALVTYVFQVAYTYSLFLVLPGFMSLVNQSQVLFGVGLAFLLFPDERPLLQSPMFFAGLLLALAGVAMVITGGSNWKGSGWNAGFLTVLLAAFSWALVGTLIKKWLPDLPSMLSLSIVFTMVTPLFLLTYAAGHGGVPIPEATPGQWALMILSGLMAVGLGQSLYYKAVPLLGISTAASLNLLGPFFSIILSYAVYRETLSLRQAVGGFVLIAGSFLIIRLRFRKIR